MTGGDGGPWDWDRAIEGLRFQAAGFDFGLSFFILTFDLDFAVLLRNISFCGRRISGTIIGRD